jgi:hypothetical protein
MSGLRTRYDLIFEILDEKEFREFMVNLWSFWGTMSIEIGFHEAQDQLCKWMFDESHDWSDSIKEAFVWQSTPEGTNYWGFISARFGGEAEQ